MPDSPITGRVLPASTSQDIKDGACLTCLAGGTAAFPLDPGFHVEQCGHIPELADLTKVCTALGITAERWEILAATPRAQAGQNVRSIGTTPNPTGGQHREQ